jgi:hypothetical protein
LEGLLLISQAWRPDAREPPARARRSRWPQGDEQVDTSEDDVKVGQKVDVRILEIDPVEHQIAVTLLRPAT